MSSPRVLSPGFQSRVFDLVRRIPSGKVTTYGRIAAVLGHPGVARHVGNALAVCGREEIPVPWHRVVNASGKISTGGSEQRELLRAEGVSFRSSGAVILDAHLWDPAEASAPPRRANPRRRAVKSQ